MDIKNIIEVLEAVKLVGVPAKAALKDGIELSDLAKLIEVVKHFEVLVAAVEGALEIPEEIKDLKSEEMVIIVAKVFEIIKAIKES